MKLNGVVKQLKYTDGQYQYSEKVAQRTKLEVEVYHPDYKTQAFTIQMGEKPFKEDIHLEEWPLLKKIIVKSSDRNYNSDDWCYARVTNRVSSCTTVLDTDSNDFQSGGTDTFTNLKNCQDFNITRFDSLEIRRKPYGDKTESDYRWLSDYIKLESYNPCVNYYCTNNDWIAADEKWRKFECKLYQRKEKC